MPVTAMREPQPGEPNRKHLLRAATTRYCEQKACNKDLLAASYHVAID